MAAILLQQHGSGPVYPFALARARTAEDVNEIEEIMDSINQLGQEPQAEQDASPNGGPATRSANSDVGGGPLSAS